MKTERVAFFFGLESLLASVFLCAVCFYTKESCLPAIFFAFVTYRLHVPFFTTVFLSFCCRKIVSKNMNEFRYLLEVFENGRLHLNRFEYFNKVKVLHLIFA